MPKTKSSKQKFSIYSSIAAIILLITCVVFQLITNSSTTTEKIYTVGKNIQPGEYVLIGNKTFKEYQNRDKTEFDGYFAICSSKKCPDKSISMAGFVPGKQYIILKKGQYFKARNLEIISIAKYNPQKITTVNVNSSTRYSDYFKVGKDLKAGTYTLSGSNYMYKICTKPSCQESQNEVLDSYPGVIDSSINQTITLKKNQYFFISGKKYTLTKRK